MHHPQVTLSEFTEWQHNSVTQELQRYLGSLRESIKEQLIWEVPSHDASFAVTRATLAAAAKAELLFDLCELRFDQLAEGLGYKVEQENEDEPSGN